MDVAIADLRVEIPGTGSPLFQIPRWQFPAGSRILLQGPSGRGKTTFLHLLAGLLRPNAGRIVVGGNELSSLDEKARALFRQKHLGIVFQKLNLFDHLTSLENVQLAREAMPADRAAQALARLGLSGKENTRSSRLSGGEQQRVAVARVLAARPDLVLADEPTASLDPANADRVIEALLANEAPGQSLVVVSHDPRLASHFRPEQILSFEELVR